MTDRSQEELEIPVNMQQWLSRYRDTSRLIDYAVDSYRRGDEILEDINNRPHLSPIRCPRPWLCVLIPVTAELQIETLRRPRPLNAAQWMPLDSETLRPYIHWTKTYPRKPVFIGNLVEIDYDSPEMTRWVYDETNTARAAHCKGIVLVPKTTTQVNKLYTPSS